MNNVLCAKVGDYYSSEYVNKLYAMCKRNLTVPFRFVCITDDHIGIHKDIDVRFMPHKILPGWWSKLAFFQKPLYDIEGPCLTLDLDMLIVDNIDCFFSYIKPSFIMKWDYRSGKKIDHGNSSCVMRFEAGRYSNIYTDFDFSKLDCGVHNTQSGFKKHKYWGDQVWITEKSPETLTWPIDWVVKYVRDCHRDSKTLQPIGERPVKNFNLSKMEFFIPENAKIVAFSGKNLRHETEIHKIKQYWHSEDIC